MNQSDCELTSDSIWKLTQNSCWKYRIFSFCTDEDWPQMDLESEVNGSYERNSAKLICKQQCLKKIYKFRRNWQIYNRIIDVDMFIQINRRSIRCKIDKDFQGGQCSRRIRPRMDVNLEYLLCYVRWRTCFLSCKTSRIHRFPRRF